MSVAKNLSNFGLTNNPSKSILTGFTDTRPQIEGEDIKVQNNKVSEIFYSINRIMNILYNLLNHLHVFNEVCIFQRKREPRQPQVVKLLEERANKPTGIKQITLPPGTVKFLTGLMEKYGDNYKVNFLFFSNIIYSNSLLVHQ